MHALSLIVPLQEWLSWVEANWVGLFSILAMLAFLVLLVVLALVPDSTSDDDSGEDLRRPSNLRRR